MAAISSISIKSRKSIPSCRAGCCNFVRFSLPLLLQPMAAEGVRLQLDFDHSSGAEFLLSQNRHCCLRVSRYWCMCGCSTFPDGPGLHAGGTFFRADHRFDSGDWGRFAPVLTSLRLTQLEVIVTAAHMQALCALPHLEALVLQCWNSNTEHTIKLGSLKSVSIPKLQLLHLDCAKLSTMRFNCSVLTSLTLRKCTLLGASSFAECPQLQRLAIKSSCLEPDGEAAWLTEQLQSLRTLQYLELEDCNLAAVPSSLSCLELLEEFHMNINSLHSLPHGLPSTLRQIRLDDNCFGCIPRELYSLSSLEHVSLMEQNGADFQLIESLLPLINLPRLQFLLLDRGEDSPCWTTESYWHIGEALRVIHLSGKKLHFQYAHGALVEDEESESSDSE